MVCCDLIVNTKTGKRIIALSNGFLCLWHAVLVTAKLSILNNLVMDLLADAWARNQIRPFFFCIP